MGGYVLGVDLGTTFSAAAVWRPDGGDPVMVRIDGDPTMPSVVYVADERAEVVGSAAEARSWEEPTRGAKEFKRRFGDPVPVMVGGAAYSPQRLTARLLAHVVGVVSETEGGQPDRVLLCHPANWGPYKRETFEQVPELAGLDGTVISYVTEPEAAAADYATRRAMAVGDLIAVYDLGGGTFDAAVVERTADGFAIRGQPGGVEHLGGVDFDAVVLEHVQASLGSRLEGLDTDDPAVVDGLAHLRDECRRAKELLSVDTAASVRVNLPGLVERVRLTRPEFEGLIAASIDDSVGVLERTIERTGVAVDDLKAVVLVGGSSRIPVIAQTVAERLGRPVAVDAHPKYATASGAALIGAVAQGHPVLPEPVAEPQTAQETVEPPQRPPAEAAAPAPSAAPPVPPVPVAEAAPTPPGPPPAAPPGAHPSSFPPAPAAPAPSGARRGWLIGGLTVLVVVVVAAVALISNDGDGDGSVAAIDGADDPSAAATHSIDDVTVTAQRMADSVTSFGTADVEPSSVGDDASPAEIDGLDACVGDTTQIFDVNASAVAGEVVTLTSGDTETSVEILVMDGESTAAEFSRSADDAFGSSAGRDCLASAFSVENLTVATLDPFSIPGADSGVLLRFESAFDVDGVERGLEGVLVVRRVDECLFLGSASSEDGTVSTAALERMFAAIDG